MKRTQQTPAPQSTPVVRVYRCVTSPRSYVVIFVFQNSKNFNINK